MITPNIAQYLYFVRNHSRVKRHGEMVERKTPRFDLTRVNGVWSGLGHLKNAKGELFVNLISSDRNGNRKEGNTVPEYYVQCTPKECKKSFNLSGLRLMQDTEENQWVCSGEPSAEVRLRTGDYNPLFAERSDGFVFILDKDFQWLEMWVIPDQRLLIDGYRKAFELGTYDYYLKQIRETAKNVGV